MKRLNTWVINPFAPTDHNVGWIDTSDEKGWVARMYNGAHVEDVPNPTPEQLGWDPVAGITEEEIKKLLDAKQDTLVSGENIKTLSNKDLLGEGNIAIKLTTNASTPNVLRIKLDSDTASSQAFKTINGETLLGEGDIITPNTKSIYRGGFADLGSLPVLAADYVPDAEGNRTPQYGDYTIVFSAGTPEWDPNEEYYEGDLINFEDVVYVCIADVWSSDYPYDDPTHWRQWFDWTLSEQIPYTGCWRFIYRGNFGSDSKWGWTPEYKVEPETITICWENGTVPYSAKMVGAGEYSEATASFAIAGNKNAKATAFNASAFGGAEASGSSSFAAGAKTGTGLNLKRATASGSGSAAFNLAAATKQYAFAVNESEASGVDSFAQGEGTEASGRGATAFGKNTIASGDHSFARGYNTEAKGNKSVAEGEGSKALKERSHAQGYNTFAAGTASSAFGNGEFTESSYTVSGAANATTYTSSAAHGLSVGDVVNFHDVYAKITAVDNTTSFTVNTTLDSPNGLNGAKINIIKGVAFGSRSVTFGNRNRATGDEAFAIGKESRAVGDQSTAEGYGVSAVGTASHAEGSQTTAAGEASHTEGSNTFTGQKAYRYINTGNVTNQLTLESVDGLEVDDVVSIINDSKYANCSKITAIEANVVTFDTLPFDTIIEDTDFDAKLIYVSEKPTVGNVDLGMYAHAEGWGSKAQNVAAHAEGKDTKAFGEYSHAEGRETIAQYSAHAEGRETEAYGVGSHAEGRNTKSIGTYSHTEGVGATAFGTGSHTEGKGTRLEFSISEVNTNRNLLLLDKSTSGIIVGDKVIVKDSILTVTKVYSAVNRIDITPQRPTVAVGDPVIVIRGSYGVYSHAEGVETITTNTGEHAEGQYNISNTGSTTADKTQHSVGIGAGSGTTPRKNAFEIMQNGDAYLLNVGTYDGTNPTSGTNDVATIINSKQDALVSGTNIKTINNESLLGSGNINIGGSSDTVPYYDTAKKSVKLYGGFPKGNGSLTLGAGRALGEGALTMGTASNNTDSANNSIQATAAGCFAGGYSSINGGIVASGPGSMAFGHSAVSGRKIQATGNGTIAMGSTALGTIEATGNFSIAIGSNTHATAAHTYAIGWGNTASYSGATAIGNGANASGENSIAISGNATALCSKSIGGNANGDYSVSIGHGVVASRANSVAIGRLNSYDSNTQFSIGAGTSTSARSNLIEVYNDEFYVKGVGGYTGSNASTSGINSVNDLLTPLILVGTIESTNGGITLDPTSYPPGCEDEYEAMAAAIDAYEAGRKVILHFTIADGDYQNETGSTILTSYTTSDVVYFAYLPKYDLHPNISLI